MLITQQVVDSYVGRAVAEFRSNPLSARLLRRLSDEQPDQFFVSAVRHLARDGAPHAAGEAGRLLTVLVMQHPGLLDYLCDPAPGKRDGAIRVAKRVLAFDPSFDVWLAGRLPAGDGSGQPTGVTGLRAARLLDVLDAVSRGSQLLPVVAHLVDNPDPKIAAKATTFIGRRVRSVDWAAKQLKQPDERRRANAVESIWGLRTLAAISLFESCVDDSNNRVAGNALVGLQIAGCPGIREQIEAMAVAPEARFRSTAAWIMGRVGSREFIDGLELLLKDAEQPVRSAALRALIGIRRLEAQSQEAGGTARTSIKDAGRAGTWLGRQAAAVS